MRRAAKNVELRWHPCPSPSRLRGAPRRCVRRRAALIAGWRRYGSVAGLGRSRARVGAGARHEAQAHTRARRRWWGARCARHERRRCSGPAGRPPPRRAGQRSDQWRAGPPARARHGAARASTIARSCVRTCVSPPAEPTAEARSADDGGGAGRRRQRGAPSGGGRDGARAAARIGGGDGRVVTAGRRHSARVMSSRTRAVGWARAWPTALVAITAQPGACRADPGR